MLQNSLFISNPLIIVCNDEFDWCRGKAVVRPGAKKHLQKQEMETSIALDVKGADVRQLEIIVKSRAGRAVYLCLVRVFRMLSIIAVVNVPLYIMLLFKDWI